MTILTSSGVRSQRRRLDAKLRTTNSIVLAGGSGLRLHPATLSSNKQRLPVSDKLMIYYLVSVPMLAGTPEIQIFSSPEHLGNDQRLFATGEQFGLSFSYAVQPRPEGLAQAFIIGRGIVSDDVVLIVGDNLFVGAGVGDLLDRAAGGRQDATVFTYRVENLQADGVVTLDSAGRAFRLAEKPRDTESTWAATGRYFYDNQVLAIAAAVKPLARGELEITSVNVVYPGRAQLYGELMNRDYAWLDTATHDSLPWKPPSSCARHSISRAFGWPASRRSPTLRASSTGHSTWRAVRGKLITRTN